MQCISCTRFVPAYEFNISAAARVKVWVFCRRRAIAKFQKTFEKVNTKFETNSSLENMKIGPKNNFAKCLREEISVEVCLMFLKRFAEMSVSGRCESVKILWTRSGKIFENEPILAIRGVETAESERSEA